MLSLIPMWPQERCAQRLEVIMKRGFVLVVGILSWAALAAAQQVVVQVPNGIEFWKKGETATIKWGCVQCSGTAELHLVRVPTSATATLPTREGYQEIGVIRASIPITPTNQFYSYSWRVGDYFGGTATLGRGYKILVKIVTPAKTVSDLSDSDFVIGAVPTIDYFGINDGLAVTNQRRVTLNYKVSGFPPPGGYRVKCTPTPGTTGQWTPLAAGTWPTYELPPQPGDYTIELSLSNDLGTGPPKTDIIHYAVATPPPATRDYTVNAATLACGGFPGMNPAWYSCRCTSYALVKPSASDCSCTSTGAVVVKTTGVALGTKVEYEFFGGRQLNPGWTFVSLSYSDAACKNDAGSAVLIMPQPGSRNILFKVRLWTEPFTLKIPSGLPVCEFRINSLVIRGPADQPVSEAFK
jgi:hypothetical protein